MPIVSVEQVVPGMVLSGPVVDRRGRLLIPAGKSLTEKHVSALKMWGVPHVEIEGDDEEAHDVGAVDPQLLERARAELRPFFIRLDRDHPFVGLLFEYCSIRRAKGWHVQQKKAGEDVA